MKREKTGYYNITQLHKSNDKIIATCLVDGDIDNRFDAVVSYELQPFIWQMCYGKWNVEKIAEIKCTYIDIDGQPENPILVKVIEKNAFNYVQW